MGLLLRTKRHTATGKQSQVLAAAVNRHMPATPRLPPATPRRGRPQVTLRSDRASTDAPSPFDPFRLLRRDRPSSALETPWRAPITGGDAGAFASRRPPLLEHRNVLVIGPRLIQGCEAVRSLTIAGAVGKRLPRKKPWGSPWTAGIKRSLSPSAPRLALRPALGLRPPFRFGAVPERAGYSPFWIAPPFERVAELVQAPPLGQGR